MTPPSTPSVEFDGICYGWRFAPDGVLQGEGLGRNLHVDCEPRQYGSAHRTDLDFVAHYLPAGGHRSSIIKWACGRMGLSVYQALSFSAYPESSVDIQRELWGSNAVSLSAQPEFVRACDVSGRPAVCVHYIDDQTGRGGHPARIVVIEDGTLDPYAVVWRLSGEELPFAELMKIAEGVLGD